KLNLGAAALEQDIGRIFADRGDRIVALRQPVEQLHPRVESVRLQFGEFLPEAVAVELTQHVPLYELQPGRRDLAADLALPARIEDVLPAFRRIGAGNLVDVVGDAGRIDAGPEEVALRRAHVVLLVRAGFRRLVVFVAALLLEIESRRQVRELEHVDVEAAGRTLRQNLAVERAGLRAHIARLDLREILAEALHDAGGAGLVLVTIKDELAFLLGLGNIGVCLEVQYFGRRFRQRLRQHTWRRDADKRKRRAGLEQDTSCNKSAFIVRHGISPWWQFSTRPSAAAFSRRLQALHHYSRVSQ